MMIFLVDDAWYLTLGKGVVLFLLLTIFFRLIKLRLWNCSAEIVDILSIRRKVKLFGLIKRIPVVFINVVFLWLLTQGLVILVMGYGGVSPKQLVEWRFQEITLIGAIIMPLVYAHIHKRKMSEFK